MKKILITVLFLIVTGNVFADIKTTNSFSMEAGLPSFTNGFSENFLSINYQRNFFDGMAGISTGIGYMSLFQDDGVFLPIHAVFTPFNTIINPEFFCGPVISWNRFDKNTSFDSKKRVFDKGADLCIDFGAGLFIRPIASIASIGATIHWYTDFDGKVNGFVSLSAGYLF